MAEYRLTELAARSGVSARNIRAYRERGLLDAPRREGRSAFYDDSHLSQLNVINELLRKGFTTAHIAEFLASARQGHDLAAILGLQQAAFGPPPSNVVSAAAVDIDPDADEVRRLLEYGLVEVTDGEVTLVNPDLAEVVGHADEQLAYVRTILRVSDGIAAALDRVAGAVVRALEDSLAARFGADCVSRPDDLAALRRMATDYRALGSHVVADRLEDALQRRLVGAVPNSSGGILTGRHPDATER